MEAIDNAVKSAENLKSSTTCVHGAFYAAEKAAIRGSSDQMVTPAGVMPALEENRVAINELRTMMEKQGEALAELSQQMKHQQQQRIKHDVHPPDQPTSPKATEGPRRKHKKQRTQPMIADAALKKDMQPLQGHQQPGAATYNSESETGEWKEVTKRRETKFPQRQNQIQPPKRSPTQRRWSGDELQGRKR